MPKKKKKMSTVKLDGKIITFEKGGLRDMLEVPIDYKFTKKRLASMMKIENGKRFTFLGKKRKMTELLKKRVIFGHNLL